MQAKVKHIGYNPILNQHYYMVLLDNGHVDLIYETTYTNEDTIEMPDELWSEGSGWITIMCDKCGHEYRERTRLGAVVSCPMCGEPEVIPLDAILEESNL